MARHVNLEELRDAGAGRPAPPEVVGLYRRAFAEFGALALWHRRPLDRPTLAQALSVAGSLKAEGNLRARRLAAEMEAACRAAF